MLLYIEHPSIFELLELSNIKLEFPSKEFGDFLELVVKWNLLDAYANAILQFLRKIYCEDIILLSSIKQGCQFLDKMVVLHLHFEKTTIMTYQDKEYSLYHRPIFDGIKELLTNPNIIEHCVFNFTPLYCEGE